MADEKSQNPFENLGRYAESEDPSTAGQDRSVNHSSEPSFYPNPGPGFNPNSGPGFNPNSGPGFNPNSGPAFNPNSGPGFNPSPGPNFYPSPDPNFHPPPYAPVPPGFEAQGPPFMPPQAPYQQPFQQPFPQPPLQPNRPIAIPAVAPSSDSPFIRAYAPILNEYNLPRDSFLSFLDQLNKVVAASPPLQVLDATGGILRSVPILFPLHWIGSAVSGLANLGSQGVSKSRTDSAVRQANKDIFGPRGLKAEIAKLDALAHVANIPILDSNGKVSRQMPLLQRLLNESGQNPQEDIQDLDLQQRRVRILRPWIADLEMATQPWTQKSKLTRFNAALKKRNDPGPAESSRDAKSQADEEETGFRKCLWLVIRPLDAQ